MNRSGTGGRQNHGRPRAARPQPDDLMKSLRIVTTLTATIGEVWNAWSTSEGLRTFFAPEALIELWPGGRFELLFRLDAPPGERGSEGCKVQTFAPGAMLAFEWNAPPEFPSVRLRKTWVVVTFTQLGLVQTRVSLVQLGWGEGPEWDLAGKYFQRTWRVVFARMEHRFTAGPVDWKRLAAGGGGAQPGA